LPLVQHVKTNSVANPVSYPVRTGSSFTGTKQLRREANNSLPSSAEVKNVFITWCLVNHRDDFTLTCCLYLRGRKLTFRHMTCPLDSSTAFHFHGVLMFFSVCFVDQRKSISFHKINTYPIHNLFSFLCNCQA
jgi:hypothetical protein